MKNTYIVLFILTSVLLFQACSTEDNNGKSGVPESKKYPIAIDDGIDNGTVTASHTSASEGERISLAVVPRENYLLSGLPLITSTDRNVGVSGWGTAWNFRMPAGDVFVSAVFSEPESLVIEDFFDFSVQTGSYSVLNNPPTGLYASGVNWAGIVLETGAWGRKCLQFTASGNNSIAGRKGPNFNQVDIKGAIEIRISAYAISESSEGDYNFIFGLETGTDEEADLWTVSFTIAEEEFGVANWIDFSFPLPDFENSFGEKLIESENTLISGYRFTANKRSSIWISHITAYGAGFLNIPQSIEEF